MFEAGDYAGGHTNTVRVDTEHATWDVDTGFIVFNDRNYPNFERLLGELGVATQPSQMSFGVSDGADFEYNGGLAERPVRQARAPRARRGFTAWSPTSCASTATRARCSPPSDDGRSLGDWLARAALLAPVRRAADRAPGVGRVVGRPARRCGRSRRASWSSSSTTTGCSGSATGRSGGRSPAARAATCEALIAALARAAAAGDAGRRRSPVTHVTSRSSPRGGEPERFDEVVLATHSDQALRAARRRERARARDARRDPLPAQRGGAAHRRSLLPRRRRAWASWNYHLLAEPPGRCTVTYHMNRLQSLRADREFCVTLNRTEAIDPEQILRTIRYAHPVYTAAGDAAQARHARSAAQPHALLRRLLGLGLPRGRRRQRARGGRGACAARVRRVNAIYEGTIRHRRFAGAPARASATASRWPTSTSTSCRRCSAAGCGRCAPALVRFRRGDYLGDPAVPLGGRGPRARRRARRARARRARCGCSTHLRYLGHCFNPVSFYYCFDARASASRRSSPR